MYVLWTSALIMELRCRQVIELWSAKEKPAPLIQLKLDLAVFPQVINYFAPIIPLFWTIDIGLMCVFWTNTAWDNSMCTVAPSPQKKLLYTGYWDYWTGMLSLNWILFKKGLRPFPGLLLHLYAPIKLHWDYRPGVWIRCSSVVIEPLCFKWTIYLIQPLFKHFLSCSRGAIMPDV